MKFIDRLNQRFGKSVRDGVVRDVANGDFAGPNRIGALVRAVAFVVVGTPYVVMGLGLALAVFAYPSIPAVAIGLVLVLAGFYLRPRADKNTEPTLTKADAPHLFALFDRISAAFDAPKIDGVHVIGDFNAYMADYAPSERVVGIGAPLWLSLDPDERLAVLAHEVAHLANNDPARNRITGSAMVTISRWFELFTPPAVIDNETQTRIVVDDRGLTGQIVAGVFGTLAGAIVFAYEKLLFSESQRAEYFADILASTIAGAAPMQSALTKLELMPLAGDALAHVYYDGSKPVPVFDVMAGAVRNPSAEASEELLGESARALHTVDSSHPPTRFRIDVIGALAPERPVLQAADFDWDQIGAELAPAFQTEEKKLLSALLVQ